MNNKSLVAGLIAFGLLLTALISQNGELAWMMLPFLAYLGVGLAQTPAVENLRLSAQRSIEQTRAGGSAQVEVSVTVTNESTSPVHLFICDNVDASITLSSGALSSRVSLAAGEKTELKYGFCSTRGNFAWQALRVLASDPLGLIETEMRLPASGTAQIRPQIKKFKSIALKPHNTVHSPGSIPARLGGSGTDFFGVREYHPGDPLRSLDWRLTARHPRKFFTKEFEQEEIAEIGLILDARQDSELRVGSASLFEHSVGATASLAEMFLHQGHRVSLLIFGETISKTFPGYGKTQLQRIMSCLAKAKVENARRSTAPLEFVPLRMFPSHALIIIISPLIPGDRPLFQRLRAYGYQALLISPDTVDFADQHLGQNTANLLATRATRIEHSLQLGSIAQMQIPVIDWRVNQPLFPLVRNALTRSRGQRE